MPKFTRMIRHGFQELATREARPAVGLRAVRVLALSLALLSVGCQTDSVLGDDEFFMADRVEEQTPSDGSLNPNGCDMTGTWIAQFRGRSQALAFVALNYSWYYYELESDGDDVVIQRSWDCGFQVCGAIKSAPTDAQFDAVALRNRQDGELFYNAASPEDSLVVEQRRASYKKLADGACEFEMGRWWALRSAPLDRYPERETYEAMTIAQVRAARPLPPEGVEADAENDWDADGVPGLEFSVDAPLRGTRDTAQREWNEFGPGVLPDGLSDFTVEAHFDFEEQLYKTSIPFLNQVTTPLKSGLTVRFVKILEQAPLDPQGFREFCWRQVDEHFRQEGAAEYCAMRVQTLTVAP